MLLPTLLSALLTLFSAPAAGNTLSAVPVATVQKGNVPFATVVDFQVGGRFVGSSLLSGAGATAFSQGNSLGTAQTLTTSVQDPSNSEEPWVVTTHRRPGESQSAFIKRHMEMVKAVRDALGPDRPR